jgi:hypothetical protein
VLMAAALDACPGIEFDGADRLSIALQRRG